MAGLNCHDGFMTLKLNKTERGRVLERLKALGWREVNFDLIHEWDIDLIEKTLSLVPGVFCFPALVQRFWKKEV